MNISKCIDYIKKYKGNAKDASLLLAQDGDLSVYYSPFDYINKEAKIVIVGITPENNNQKMHSKLRKLPYKQEKPMQKFCS